MPHFLDIAGIVPDTLHALLERAAALKAERREGHSAPLAGRQLAMIFEKNSTRTRVSFEVGMKELGGNALFLSRNDLQLGRGETVADTARVLSRYVDLIMARCMRHDTLLELAEHATVPIINGLTDVSHPCQIMADLLTMREHLGGIEEKTVAWCGAWNNVARSWLHAAAQLNFTLRLACPPRLRPTPEDLAFAENKQARVIVTDTPEAAVTGADCVVTDTWISMGEENQSERLRTLLMPYQVTEALMAHAKPEAIFMHCLPAHRGEEMTPGVIDGPQSVVFDEAENRLHAQKAVMLWCLGA